MQLQKASFGAEAAAPGSVRVLVLYNASSASTL